MHRHGRYSGVPSGVSRETIERLSTPKAKDKRWIPDRPSVYWLDYIIDPTPHRLRDPEDLASYYDNFAPRFPRTRVLSAPRKYYGTLYRDDDEIRPVSISGVPVSALTYRPTSRILELAQPKPKTAISGSYFRDEPGSSFKTRPSTSRPSLPTGRSQSPQGKAPYFTSNDLARGDFPSRSKHGIHSNKERSTSAGNQQKTRSRSRNSNLFDSRVDKRQPTRKGPFSLKN